MVDDERRHRGVLLVDRRLAATPLHDELHCCHRTDAHAARRREPIDSTRRSAPCRPAANGLIVLPFFSGERTPNLPSASASISGLKAHNCTRGHLLSGDRRGRDLRPALRSRRAAPAGTRVVGNRPDRRRREQRGLVPGRGRHLRPPGHAARAGRRRVLRRRPAGALDHSSAVPIPALRSQDITRTTPEPSSGCVPHAGRGHRRPLSSTSTRPIAAPSTKWRPNSSSQRSMTMSANPHIGDPRILPGHRPGLLTKDPSPTIHSLSRLYDARQRDRRENDGGAPALRRLLLAHASAPMAAIRSARVRAAMPGRRRRNRWRARKTSWTPRSNSSPRWACRTTVSMTSTSRRKAKIGRPRARSSCSTWWTWRANGRSPPDVKLLWGTANLFSHPRYMNGASTNPDFEVVAHAAAQVKAALDATVELGGENYVFWGGREGYSYLLNTNTKRELEHMARFLGMARDYGRSIGFKGTFLIEPKPMEPMKHQYDFDAQTVIGFLRHHGLGRRFQGQCRGQPRHARGPYLRPRPADVHGCRPARQRSMPIAAIRRTAGTPTSSRPTCTTRSTPCWWCWPTAA